MLVEWRTYLGDTDDHVVDCASDSAQARNVLTPALPYGEADLLLALDELRLDLNVHVDMSEVLLERPARPSDGYQARLDGHSHIVGDRELFGGKDVAHLEGEVRLPNKIVSSAT